MRDLTYVVDDKGLVVGRRRSSSLFGFRWLSRSWVEEKVTSNLTKISGFSLDAVLTVKI